MTAAVPDLVARLAWKDPAASWRDDALCAQVDTELFYPEKGGSTKDAKRLCGLCPVQAECLSWAMDRGERYGVWGGLSERERRRLTRLRGAA